MNAEVVGVVTGIIIGLIICIIIYVTCNSNKKIKSEYDERQKEIRGTSYTYGFYSVIIYLALMLIFFMSDIAIPFVLPVIAFFGIFIGICVVAIHSIWNGAYWGLNNNKTKYFIVMTLCTVINLGVGIMGIVNGTILLGYQGQLINLLCGIMFLIIGAVTFIKGKISPDADIDEEA